MDTLKSFYETDTAFSKACDALCSAFQAVMLEKIPFNEDDRFIFTEEGGMDVEELPTITIGDGTQSTCIGLEKGDDCLYVLFGDDDDEEYQFELSAEEVSVEGIREIFFLLEDRLK